MVSIAEARPPYVAFEVRAEEDREASIKAGHYIAIDVDYALITPMGSKDRIERVAKEWLDKIQQDVVEGRMPREWANAYRDAYKAWKEGLEIPVSGTPVENWPPASPAQIKMLRQLQVRTVEDLANANEEVITRIGMGGRALKQRAVDWLAAAAGGGKLSEEMTALRAENENLRQRNESLETQMRELVLRVDALAGDKSSGKKL